MNRICTSTVLFLFALLRAAPCMAQELASELEKSKPEIVVELKMSSESTTKFYSTRDDAESNSMFKTRLDASAEFPMGRERSLMLDLDIARTDDGKYATEDMTESGFRAEWAQPLGRGQAGALARMEKTDASNQSLTVLNGSTRELGLYYMHPLGRGNTLRLDAFSAAEFYSDQDQDSREHGWSAAVSRDFGNFVYVSVGYRSERTHYPGEAMVDISYNDTSAHRSDRTNTFTASVSRLVSLYPLAYIQISYEKSRNASDSNGYYFWYNDATFEYGEKLVPGYDVYNQTALSVFALRDFDENTSATAYYLSDKTRYPNRYAGNYGQTEPSTPTENKLTYIMLEIRRMLNGSQSLFLSRTWVNSRSNDSIYEYKEQVTALGLINRF
jgi:hypothetical protein